MKEEEETSYVMVFTCPMCPDVAQLPKPPAPQVPAKQMKRFVRYAVLLLRCVFLV